MRLRHAVGVFVSAFGDARGVRCAPRRGASEPPSKVEAERAGEGKRAAYGPARRRLFEKSGEGGRQTWCWLVDVGVRKHAMGAGGVWAG